MRCCECGNVDVKAAVGVEEMFVRRCEDLIPFVEFGRWCWCAGMPWNSVALDVLKLNCAQSGLWLLMPLQKYRLVVPYDVGSSCPYVRM